MTNTAYQTSGPAYNNTPAAPSSDLSSAASMAMGWGIGSILTAIGGAIMAGIAGIALAALQSVKNDPNVQIPANANSGVLTLGLVASILALILGIVTAIQAFKLRKGYQAGQNPAYMVPMILSIIAIICGFIGGGLLYLIAGLVLGIFMIMTIMKANAAKKAPAAPATGYAPAIQDPTSYNNTTATTGYGTPTSYSNTTTTDYGNTQQTTTTTTTDYNQAPRP